MMRMNIRNIYRRYSSMIDDAISPLDGRYKSKISYISSYFSEAAFIRYRIITEIEWLKHLAKSNIIPLDSNVSTEQFNSMYI